VRAQVDRALTTVDYFDRLLGLIKNLGRHRWAEEEGRVAHFDESAREVGHEEEGSGGRRRGVAERD
jgi:hypothetical protein